ISLPAFGNTGLDLPDGTYQIVIQAFDDDGTGNPTGNPRGTQTVEITVDTAAPTLVSIDTPIAANGEINIADSQNDLVITGTSSGAEDGAEVVVTLNSVAHSGTVTADAWSVTVPASAVQDLPDGTVAISVEVFDLARNSDTGSENVDVDLTPPTISITALPFGDFLNLGDTGAPQTINGTSDGANGRTVTLTVIDSAGATSTFTDTTDAVTGAWSIDLPIITLQALAEGAATLSATVTDSFNNPPDSPATAPFTVDTIAPNVEVTQIAGDGIINIPEQAGGFTVSGTSNAEEGQLVTVLIDGVTATNTGTVDANGTWTVSILPADVAGLINADTPAFTARVQDQAENETTSAPVTANVNLTEPTIAITQIGGNGFININEQDEDGITVTGTTNAEDGQDVEVTLTQGSTTATTTVQVQAGGTFTAPFTPAQLADFTDGAITATATVENAIGNTGTSAGFDGTVDLIAPTISISDPLAGDGTFTKLNEANGLDVTGTTNAEVGQIVTVTYNGVDYTGAVVDGAPGLNTFTVPIPDTAFAGVDTGDTITGITARVSDQAGNPSDVATGPTLSVDLTGPSITINPIAVDNIINIAERDDAGGVEISGIASGADEQTVTVEIRDASNAVVFTATDEAALGTGEWSVIIPQAIVGPLANDATFTVTADVSDFEGIAAPTATLSFDTDFNNPTITIGALPFGSFLNALNTESEQSISGTSTGANEQTVTLTVTDQAGVVRTFTGDTNATTGAWSIPIPTGILEILAEGTATLSATVNSAADNPPTAPATTTFTVDTVAPDITITEPGFLDVGAGDTFLNNTEAGILQTINGTAPGAEAGQPVTLTITDSTGTVVTITPDPQVDGSGNWTVDVDLSGLAEGAVTISAMVSDAAGNPADAPAELSFTKDTIAPDVQITQIAGDDIINIPEQDQGFTVSGTSNAEEGQHVTVLIDGVAATNTGAVDSSGNWTVTILPGDVTGLNDGDTPAFTARVQDQAENETTSAPVTANVNLTPPTITFATLAGDDILNIAESNAAELTIGGTTTGFANGDQITLSANGITDITLTVTGNAFTHNIAREDVFALIVAATGAAPDLDGSGNLISAGAGDITFTASGTNNVGNPSGNVTTDLALALTPPALAIGDIEGTGGTALDGVININERAAGLEINGTSDAEGRIVTVTLTDGAGFTASATGTVTGGIWQADFAAGSLNDVPDVTTEISLTAEVTDTNDNGTTTAPTTMPADFIAPVVTIASVESGGEAIGDFINIDERDAGITVSGTTDAENGQRATVTLSAAGISDIVVESDPVVDGHWTVSFNSTQLGTLPDAVMATLTASISDASGNPADPPFSQTVETAFTPPEVAIDTHAIDGLITGTSTGLNDGDTVHITLANTVDPSVDFNTYTTTVDALGNWEFQVPTTSDSSFEGIGFAYNSQINISATVTDIALNSGEVTAPVTIYKEALLRILESSRDATTATYEVFASEDIVGITFNLRYDEVAVSYTGDATPRIDYQIFAIRSDNVPGLETGLGTDIIRVALTAINFGTGVEGTTEPTSVPVLTVLLNLLDTSVVSHIELISDLTNIGVQGGNSETWIGTGIQDTITVGSISSVVRGMGGDDTIHLEEGGTNIILFEADPSANGLDTITGFSSLNTALPDRIGFAGLDNSTLRGTGTDFQALGDGDPLGADTGFVVLTFNTGLTAVDLETAAANLVGEAQDDIIYLLATDGTNAALARVEYTAVDTASAEIMANFTGLGDLSGITANEILGFNTV
uniref:Ig-like domain-containing protein n=1 Tax=Roseinatronobacter sp. TaxID=1945755 RepID=UPI003F7164CC